MLAIFKAGGAYLPLDPHLPASRICQLITQSGSKLVLAEYDSVPVLVEALSQLLAGLPADTGMAFVLIQHLDPKHESNLERILAKAHHHDAAHHLALAVEIGEAAPQLRPERDRADVLDRDW